MRKSTPAGWGIVGRRCLAVAGFALAVLAARPGRAVDYVNDPLTEPVFPGRGSQGGSFSPSGWTVTGEADAVWYEITDALPSGRVEYTVTGLSLATTLTGVDHDIFTMYQAPTGIAEPVPYMPYFRNNDFKVFTRIFGTGETGRPGAMKIELAFCPRGEPWYHDDVCAAECDRSGLAYAPGDTGWDAGASYRMAVEWGGERMAFYRDGTELAAVPYPGEWAPQPLRVRLGSPRHDGIYPGAAMMPIGITIRDVLIQGTPGTRTPPCGADADADADADAVEPPDGDAGVGEFAVLADVTAASWEAGVFPDVTDLNVEADSAGAPTGVAYLRFPAVSGTVRRAVLRLHTQAYGSAAGGAGQVCAVADDSWDENTMTWATRPPVGSACTGVIGSVDPDVEVAWDVTALVAGGGRINLAVVSDDSNGVHYLSKEAGSPVNAPRLLVETAPAVDGGDGDDASDEDGGGDADAPEVREGGPDQGLDADANRDAARDAAPRGDDGGGCSCRSAGRPAPSIGLVLLGALAVAAATRRRRTPCPPPIRRPFGDRRPSGRRRARSEEQALAFAVRVPLEDELPAPPPR